MEGTKKIATILGLTAVSIGGIWAFAMVRANKRKKEAMIMYSLVEEYIAPEKSVNKSSAFDVRFGDNPSSYTGGAGGDCPSGEKVEILPISKAVDYANKIHDAFGIFYDSTAKVFGILQGLSSKAQIAQVSSAFFKKHDMAMEVYLEEEFCDAWYCLGSGEFKKALGIIEAKPKVTCSPSFIGPPNPYKNFNEVEQDDTGFFEQSDNSLELA